MNWLDASDDGAVLDWFGYDGTSAVAPYGPAGVGTLMLDIETGFSVSHRWPFDLQKFQGGKEKRIPRNDAPQQSYSGNALLLGPNPRAIRAQLARYAAQGSQFLLALPHEMLTLSANASGATVFVNAAAQAAVDWFKPGQRCVVARRDTTNELAYINATIQTTSSGSAVLDISPGTPGLIGGFIAPCMPVYLEPQQDFARYPVKAESWKIQARAAIFDYAPTLASVSVDDPTHFFAATGAIAYSRYFGAYGNTLRLVFVQGGGYPAAGEMVESGTTTTIHVNPLVTTLGNLATLLTSSANFRLGGTYNAATAIGWDLDITASGGSITGDVGTGAAVTTYTGDGTARPVWDRYLDNDTTAQDSIHSMTRIFDHGAIPYAIGTADHADWGRSVRLEADLTEWQWLKLFISTVKGQQKPFWLPTWRDDLTFVSKAANTITVSTTDGSDFSAWWPYQRQDIQIVETSGTVTRARVTAAVDNGNGTITLTIGTTLATSSVSLISWLELSRFESDQFQTEFLDASLVFSTVARVIFDQNSQSTPREYATISYGTTTHLMSFTERDLVVGGVVYPAIAGARGEIGIASPGGNTKTTTITLPIDHAFVARYLQGGVPPGKIAATIMRQEYDASTVQQWSGEIDGCQMSDDCTEATFNIVSGAGRVGLRVIPNVPIGRFCPHRVFEGMCGRELLRTGTSPDGVVYKYSGAIVSVDGRDVRINLSNVPVGNARRADWCLGGDLLHVASGERRTIRDQQDLSPGVGTTTQLTLHVPIVELKAGDTVEVYPGCDKTIGGAQGCDPKFGNRHNFGGFPELPAVNPFVPGANNTDQFG